MLKTTLLLARRRAGLLLAVAFVAASAAAFTRAAPLRFMSVDATAPLSACRVPDAGVLYQPDADCTEADHVIHDIVTGVEVVELAATIESGDFVVFAACPSGKWPIGGGYGNFGYAHSADQQHSGRIEVHTSRADGDPVAGPLGWQVEGTVPFVDIPPDEFGGGGQTITLSAEVELRIFCAYLGRGAILH